MGGRRMLRWTAAGCLLAAIGCTTAVPAGAATGRAAGGATCTGTAATPGHLAGTYPTGVVVKGYCQVDGGAAVVDGTLTVAPGATLDASFVHNDVAGTGSSSLSVTGNVKVGRGATLVVGCEPGYFSCSDDPSATLSGSDHVSGNLVAKSALGVVVHNVSIGGNVAESSGGGGVNCNEPPSGPFAGTGDFSDYEDDTIGGNLHVTGLKSCWMGMLRNHVSGNLTDSQNQFNDPDANEALHNTVGKNITCTGNSPAVQYGDSGETPNVVTGKAFGECAFTLASGTPVSVKA